MSTDPLTTYLNDHLVGAVVALSLLEHLQRVHRGEPLERFFRDLSGEIESDRAELEELMARLGAARSGLRRSAAWVTEKATELKLRLDDPRGGPLRLLEALDALVGGVEGKRALWAALRAAADVQPRLRQLDFDRLERRALDQKDRLEAQRLDAARQALAGDGPPPRHAPGASPPAP